MPTRAGRNLSRNGSMGFGMLTDERDIEPAKTYWKEYLSHEEP
jgi:hypothetical protein